MTRKGQVDEASLGNWTAYLDRYQEWIEKGFQFTRLAVQEPYGVMILQVKGIVRMISRSFISRSLETSQKAPFTYYSDRESV